MKFHKYHGLGNDYIVIDPKDTEIKLNADMIKRICHRNYGIGSDGILYGPVIRENYFEYLPRQFPPIDQEKFP